MKHALIIAMCSFIVAAPVLAQPDTTAETAPPTATTPEKKVTPLKLGAKAPFTGLLVPEDHFSDLLESDVRRENAVAKLRVEEKFSASLEKMYNSKLVQAAKSPPFYKTNSFNRWLGFALGATMATLAIYGGSQLIRRVD